jgi:hypothetical protein
VKPVTQTVIGQGKGNCMAAALASLLELPIEDVPNFSEFGGQFWPKLWEWLSARNLCMMATHVKPNGYHLIRVISPRGNFHHEMVGFNGDPVHDPYPGGNCQHDGIVFYDLIYPMDISKPILTDDTQSKQAEYPADCHL